MKAPFEPRIPWDDFVRWLLPILWVVPVAILAGSASALFLSALDLVTRWRWEHPWLLYLLPLAGPLIMGLYLRHGRGTERGTLLILEEIHKPGGGVPFRMAPLVLTTTLLTHLFGGSAGREGTAIQMGGALASGVIRGLRLGQRQHRIVLMAGIAAGFGSVFGTPLAGAVFAVEVLVVGGFSYESLLPCLAAAWVADLTCSWWGIRHTSYAIAPVRASSQFLVGHLDLILISKALLAGVLFGWTARLFSSVSHFLHRQFQSRVSSPWIRPVIGGGAVILLTMTLGTRSYLGLGVTSPDPGEVTLVSCFVAGGAHSLSWFWKLLFTAITLSSGFKGGEVTPLFFIGAALGNTLSVWLDTPADWMAGLGFVAVFGGASKTPLACALMGIELFGAEHAVYLAAACFMAYAMSGPSGIYRAQRPTVSK